MKSIIGQKIGMTQVFTKAGESIPVTVIKVEPNVVTNVLTKEKHGYNAIQLATIEQKKSRQKKPLVGHFEKAGTTPKKVVREMRDMNGYSLGEKVAVSIFKIGELVDVIGTSKGKGFAGSIKRHNQTIGPKSHGGGGGSKPVRQTGSLGEIKSNKVFKGMTMPGHLGHERVTVQNLEVVNVDAEHDLLLIRGSIPGPKKSYVIVRQAIKGLKNKTGVKLVDLKESLMKNKLLEEAKKYGASVNTDMSLEHMKKAVASAKDLKESQALLEQAQAELSKLTEQKSKSSNELTNYEAELAKVQQSQNQDEITVLKEKIANLTNTIQGLDNKIAEINDDIKQKNERVNLAQKTAKEYQIESDEKSTDLSTNKGAK